MQFELFPFVYIVCYIIRNKENFFLVSWRYEKKNHLITLYDCEAVSYKKTLSHYETAKRFNTKKPNHTV